MYYLLWRHYSGVVSLWAVRSCSGPGRNVLVENQFTGDGAQRLPSGCSQRDAGWSPATDRERRWGDKFPSLISCPWATPANITSCCHFLHSAIWHINHVKHCSLHSSGHLVKHVLILMDWWILILVWTMMPRRAEIVVWDAGDIGIIPARERESFGSVLS